jgi:hypothetical protein
MREITAQLIALDGRPFQMGGSPRIGAGEFTPKPLNSLSIRHSQNSACDDHHLSNNKRPPAMETSNNKTKAEVIELLQQFDWNWHLAADYLGTDANALKEEFGAEAVRRTRATAPPEVGAPVTMGNVHPDQIARLRDFIREHLADSLPILFDDNCGPERREEITTAILLEVGFGYKLTHAPEFRDTFKTLEDEAFLLAKWREQMMYLSVVEDALFRVAIKLRRESIDQRRAEEALEQDE